MDGVTKSQSLAHCRRLAASISDTRTVCTLKGMAAEYEDQAAQLSSAN